MGALMATLRASVAKDAPDAKLSQRGVNVWLTAAVIDNMRDLWDASNGPDVTERWQAQRDAWRLYSGAWSFPGTFDELLTMWAEDRRESACVAWVRAAPGRSIVNFGPFGSARHDLL